MRFKDKAVLITGVATGIGRTTAQLFAKEGAKVIGADINPEEGEKTIEIIKESGYEGLFIQADVSLVAAAERLVKTAMNHYERIDVVFNNAGVILPKSLLDTTEEDWERVISIDLKGIYFVSKYAIAEMIRTGGGVMINNASCAGILGFPMLTAYCAAKGGIVSLTRALAAEYAKDNIRVNCICPGFVDTPMSRGFINALEDGDAVRKQFEEQTPLGRIAFPEDIAKTILFLAGDESSYLTGAIIPVDGGLSAV